MYPNTAMSSIPRLLGSGGLVCVLGYVVQQSQEASMGMRFVPTIGLSTLALFVAFQFIELMRPMFEKAGIGGKDINKNGTPFGDVLVPESLGLIPATTYVLVLCILQAIPYAPLNGVSNLYTAAMASVTFMILLGFADDVLDLRWRYKLVLPLVASLPLLVNYGGRTGVLVPRGLRDIVITVGRALGGKGEFASASGRLVDIGIGYYVYMALLSIFCTNAINIYAGINGLEAGQSFIIALFVLIHNASNLNPSTPVDDAQLLRLRHALSIDMIMPFAAVTLALLWYNWYPSSVFVGDTFCYFAGMTFAMSAVLGHYSATLLLFFIPQIINFLYSTPQLFGIVHCPRHRLPRYNVKTGKLEAIKTNLNLVNLTLWITGPMTEKNLCIVLLALQVVSCACGMALRVFLVNYLQ